MKALKVGNINWSTLAPQGPWYPYQISYNLIITLTCEKVVLCNFSLLRKARDVESLPIDKAAVRSVKALNKLFAGQGKRSSNKRINIKLMHVGNRFSTLNYRVRLLFFVRVQNVSVAKNKTLNPYHIFPYCIIKYLFFFAPIIICLHHSSSRQKA